MRISLILPTLNAGRSLENLLSLLSSQDTRPSEIIIIDSSSEDNTVAVAERFGAKTIVIPRKAFNHGKTRNTAAMEAKGDVLVFMTQDALPFDNSLLSNLTGPLKNGIAAAYGRHVPRPDAPPLEVFARQFNYPDMPVTKKMEDVRKCGIKTFFFSNVCSAIERETFIGLGMFPEEVKANEDMIMAAKLILNGRRIAYVPGAVVIHSHNYSLIRLFRRYYYIGSSLKQNRWILDYAHSEGEGLQFVKEQFLFVLKRHRYSCIPYIFLEAVAKYSGYKTGLIAG